MDRVGAVTQFCHENGSGSMPWERRVVGSRWRQGGSQRVFQGLCQGILSLSQSRGLINGTESMGVWLDGALCWGF